MEARKTAAQFAAYMWFENVSRGAATSQEIARFAKERWPAFLPLAQEGFGKLLLRVAAKPRIRKSPRRARRLVGAST